ncbi:hypothetical protein JRO89_XS03G0033300 [Xanthoceras sorbifolium]|uniref:Uncharacterized protein n=1 Tax=Xanthoceras sorbifolium TaxID=99658 RepID=A0ABQ8I8P8_9ROSI|nr:hypothetical protein JRO89_XS03G0033300 [Xanthoceras sorbifolium]
MALAQPSMDITVKVEPDQESKCVLSNSDEKDLSCMNDCGRIGEKEALLTGQTAVQEVPDNVDVDIIKFTEIDRSRLAEAEDPNATDYSSSFGNSESDGERYSGLSEAEVESQYFGDSGLASTYDAFSSTFHVRKKKLTTHWRSFIHPLMWRCKWAELRIKEIESQASKYARELEAYDQRKHSRIDQSALEGLGSKSFPFSSQLYRKKAMKRRKRKRVEDTIDITSYMSHHNLFSYLESKRSNPDGNSANDDFGNTGNSLFCMLILIGHPKILLKITETCSPSEGISDVLKAVWHFILTLTECCLFVCFCVSTALIDQQADYNDKFACNDDPLFFEFRDGDNELEQVLWKIEIVYSRVHKLKSQLDMVMSKNASKFSSSENLSLLAPCDAQTSSAPSPTFSAGNADTTSVGAIYNPTQHISEYDLGDLVMPEGAISSYAEAVHVPDIIESTVGLLSAADVTFHQPQIGDSCEDILDNILIQNDGAGEEQHTFLGTSNQSLEKHHEPEKGEEGESTLPSPIPSSEPDNMAKSVVPQEQTLKSCLSSDFHVPTNKRKRGERKAGPGSWNRKGSGEPDSQ